MWKIFRDVGFEYICPPRSEQTENFVVIRAILFCAIIPAVLHSQQRDSQHVGSPIARLEAGTLTPGDLTLTTLAIGASAGWQFSNHTSLLLRYLRQSQNRNSGADVGRLARSFVTVNWEYALGPGGRYHRQGLVRVGVGALFRPYLKTAPVCGAAFELRYGLTAKWALVGSIEDDVGALPREDFQFCPTCPVTTFPGKVQHNFGFIVAGEWRR